MFTIFDLLSYVVSPQPFNYQGPVHDFVNIQFTNKNLSAQNELNEIGISPRAREFGNHR
ncbi:MAG: hypothetical protein ACI97X_001848, partial [Oceanospirillaceae bacterium]